MVAASIIIPCYNEEKTLRESVERLIAICGEDLTLEIIIIDDGSTDRSREVALELGREHSNLRLIEHTSNQGKGAALRSGFAAATGEVVAVHDADLEYNPRDLKKLINLVRENKADVVFGSRFLAGEEHRVLYFWHSLGNRFLTFLSNMLTDLNLTDMEACYKVFKREVIQGIEICENRFGVEPEIVAKVAQMKLRIYEMGVSYAGRTYEEGKKIGIRDGLRALYCIVRYNAYRASLPLQLAFYLPHTLVAILAGIAAYRLMINVQAGEAGVAVAGFATATLVGYFTFAIINAIGSTALIFRKKSRWGHCLEILLHVLVLGLAFVVEIVTSSAFFCAGWTWICAKLCSFSIASMLIYLGYRFVVFSAKDSPHHAGSGSE